MKKTLILAALAVLCTVAAKAQTKQGDQLLGGSILLRTINGTQDYNSPVNNSNNYSGNVSDKSFGIGPTYSYFVANKLDLGLSASYFVDKQTGTYVPSTYQLTLSRSHSYFASVFLRKYFLYNNKVGIRTGPFASYQYLTTESKYADPSYNTYYPNSNTKTFDAGLALDFVYFPVKRLGLASTLGSLYYQHYNSNVSYEIQKNNSFTLNLLSSGLTISAFYCFGK